MSRPPRWLLAAALAATVVLVGCTDGERRDDAGPEMTPPTTVQATPQGASDCPTTSVDTLRDQVYLEGTGAPVELTSLDVHTPVRGPGCPPTPV
ncbi:MAG: hypothetical protein ACK4V6_17930, partial [Microthrixaceae bacterium]